MPSCYWHLVWNRSCCTQVVSLSLSIHCLLKRVDLESYLLSFILLSIINGIYYEIACGLHIIRWWRRAWIIQRIRNRGMMMMIVYIYLYINGRLDMINDKHTHRKNQTKKSFLSCHHFCFSFVSHLILKRKGEKNMTDTHKLYTCQNTTYSPMSSFSMMILKKKRRRE